MSLPDHQPYSYRISHRCMFATNGMHYRTRLDSLPNHCWVWFKLSNYYQTASCSLTYSCPSTHLHLLKFNMLTLVHFPLFCPFAHTTCSSSSFFNFEINANTCKHNMFINLPIPTSFVQHYYPTKEDKYFIIGLSRRGEDWPQFPKLSIGVEVETQLIYVQRYVSPYILEPKDFQVVGG